MRMRNFLIFLMFLLATVGFAKGGGEVRSQKPVAHQLEESRQSQVLGSELPSAKDDAPPVTDRVNPKSKIPNRNSRRLRRLH